MKCEYCGEEEADLFSRNENKWYHTDCFVRLKNREKLGGKVACNCFFFLIVLYLFFNILHWLK